MNMITDCYTLNNGMKLPCIGFGTCRTTDDAGKQAILSAIRAGYRFFDTASFYATERVLGDAIRESGLPREDFIIETKLWISEMGYDNAKAAFARSLERLQTDYVDLYLIHWPRRTGADDEDWKQLDLDTWRAMEELVDEGKIRALGCSNFLPHHLENLLTHARIKPVVDQLELHPGYSQEAAVAFCLANDIVPIAWSPLGRGRDAALAGNNILERLAKKYDRSAAQICLRFLLQKGILPIPKAASPEHIAANAAVFDFTLSDEDVWMLSCMPQTTWLGEHPDFVIPTNKPFPDAQ